MGRKSDERTQGKELRQKNSGEGTQGKELRGRN